MYKVKPLSVILCAGHLTEIRQTQGEIVLFVGIIREVVVIDIGNTQLSPLNVMLCDIIKS